MSEVWEFAPRKVKRFEGTTGVIDAHRDPRGRENWRMYRFTPDGGGRRVWISAISFDYIALEAPDA